MKHPAILTGSLGTVLSIALCIQVPAIAASEAPETPTPPAPALPSYLVIPPASRSDGRQDARRVPWLGEALAEAITTGLTGAGADVASRDERRGIERELGISPGAVTTLATRMKEAEELEVERVVLGDYSISDDLVHVTLRVYDHAAGSRGPELRLDPVPLTQLARLQTETSDGLLIGEGLRSAEGLPNETPFAAPAAEGSPSAYESRIRALIEEDPLRKTPLLERAVAEDPNYLRARFELALALRDAGTPEKALSVLNARPLQGGADATGRFDPAGRADPAVRAGLVADAEALLGSLALDAGLMSASVDAFRRSLRARDDADVRIQLARALVARGDRAVAAAELVLARRLDPLNPEIADVQDLVDAAAAAPSPPAP